MIKYEILLPQGYQPVALPGRDIWTAALRSGQYRQGHECLSMDGLDCCLGVLCKLQGRTSSPSQMYPGRLVFDGHVDLLDATNPAHPHIGENGHFPEGVTVQIWDHEDPEHVARDTSVCLAGCNDQGLTFDQIADIIEQVWTNAPPNWETT